MKATARLKTRIGGSDTGATAQMERKKKSAKLKRSVASAKPPVRARGRERVDKIISATIQLLENHELSDLTIMMIADKAKVGRSSVYEFFPTIESILRVIAENYADEVIKNTGKILVDLNSHSLVEIVDALIDGTVNFFNERPAAAKIHLGTDASFGLRVMVRDFHRAGASVYHRWYKSQWEYESLGEDDPFRTLSVLQYALLSESVQRHGRITDYFRHQLKLIAHAYLSHFTSEIVPIKPEPPRTPIAKTVTPNYIISLESGRKLKSLTAYLKENYDMTPEDYRKKWRLPPDYPMIAPRAPK